MDTSSHNADAKVQLKPFGIEFLEEVVLPEAVLGSQTCTTHWSDLKSEGDDVGETTNNDPCI